MKTRRKRGDGSIYLRGRIWWIKYSVNGEPVPESSDSDKESEARKLLKKRLGEIATGHFIGPDAERLRFASWRMMFERLPSQRQESLDKAERIGQADQGAFSGMQRRTA